MLTAGIIILIFFVIVEALNPTAGIRMLAFVFVGGMFSWIMWVLRDQKMAVAGLMSTGMLMLYTLLEVIEPISNLLKNIMGG